MPLSYSWGVSGPMVLFSLPLSSVCIQETLKFCRNEINELQCYSIIELEEYLSGMQ